MKNHLLLLLLPLALTACGQPASRFDTRTIKAGKGSASIESTDFNKDGFADLAVANAGDSSISILLGDGKGNLNPSKGSPFFAGYVPNDMNLADFNNDGNTDILVADHERKYVRLLLGDGKGGFRESPYSPMPVTVRPHTHGVASGDFNKDGFRDWVTDSWGSDEIVVVSGLPNGGYGDPVIYAVGDHPYQRVRVADINRDGSDDIVTSNLEDHNCTILLNDGKGNFKQQGIVTSYAGDAPFGIAIADLNADGNPDIAVINAPSVSNQPGSDGLTLLLGDGTGQFRLSRELHYSTGSGPVRIAVGDINGDKIMDIAVVNYKSNTATIYIMDNALHATPYTLGTGVYPDGVVICDLNRDGRGEVIVGNNGDDTITIINWLK